IDELRQVAHRERTEAFVLQPQHVLAESLGCGVDPRVGHVGYAMELKYDDLPIAGVGYDVTEVLERPVGVCVPGGRNEEAMVPPRVVDRSDDSLPVLLLGHLSAASEAHADVPQHLHCLGPEEVACVPE